MNNIVIPLPIDNKSDFNRIPQPNNNILNQLLLPLICNQIFCYLSDSSQSLSNLSKVCYSWNYEIMLGPDSHWEILCRNKWKYLSKSIQPDSWLMFYRKRSQKLMKKMIQDWTGEKIDYASVIPIENCDRDNEFISKIGKYEKLKNELSDTTSLPEGLQWDFECPVALNRLTNTSDPQVDFCLVCKKSVYLVKTEIELRAKVRIGECVSFSTIDIELQRELKSAGAILMGRMIATSEFNDENEELDDDWD